MPQARILEPGEMEAAAKPIPDLILPSAGLFSARAARLRALANGHSLGDYLRFMADLADAQHAHRGAFSALAVDSEVVAHCRIHAMPPLSVAGVKRDPHWRKLARQIAQVLLGHAPAPAQSVMHSIAVAEDDWLEAQAVALLELNLGALDVAAAPVISGALQVYWSHLAGSLDPADVGRAEPARLCPVCGAHPCASVVRLGGTEHGLRYLVCSLCSAQWYLERVKCSNCGNSKDIAYHAIEQADSAVRAEACPQCESYLKIFYTDKRPDLDPTADDLATLALDWLMSEAGFSRSGVSLFMLQAER